MTAVTRRESIISFDLNWQQGDSKLFATVYITINCKAVSSIDFKVMSKFNQV